MFQFTSFLSLSYSLAAEAVRVMERMEISVLVAVEDGRPVGMVHIHELLKAGVA